MVAMDTSVAMDTMVALDTVFISITRVSMVTTDNSMLVLVLGTAWIRKGLATFDGGMFWVGKSSLLFHPPYDLLLFVWHRRWWKVGGTCL